MAQDGYRAGRLARMLRHRRAQRGFILSVEAILVLTIVGLGLLVGIVAVRDALFVRKAYVAHTHFVVVDSSDPPRLVGEAVGFDEHDTPLVPFVDYGYPDAAPGYPSYRTLIGVRPKRFTSRQPVFYEDEGCPAPEALADSNVCLALPNSERARAILEAALEAAGLSGGSAFSYLPALQIGPNGSPGPLYGIGYETEDGVTNEALGGVLYRSTVEPDCDGVTIQSIWYSLAPAATVGGICLQVPDAPDDPPPADASFLSAEPVTLEDESDWVLSPLTPPFWITPVLNPGTIKRTPPCPEGDLDCLIGAD